MEDPCGFAKELSQDIGILITLAIRTCLSFGSIVAFFFAYVIESVTHVLHPNGRIILRAHCFAVFLAAIGCCGTDGADFVRLTFGKDGDNEKCPVEPMPAKVGLIAKLLMIFGNNCAIITLTFLAIERLVATLRAKTYERKESAMIGWILTLCAVTVAIISVVVIVVKIDFNRVIPVSVLFGPAVDMGKMVLFCMLGLEVTNAAVFFSISRINQSWQKRLTMKGATLCHKYQIKENVNFCAVLTPLAVLHCLMTIITCASIPLVLSFTKSNHAVYATSRMADFIVIYDFLLPLLLMYKSLWHRKCLSEFIQRLLFGKRVAQVAQHSEMDNHFQMLNDIFEGSHKGKKK